MYLPYEWLKLHAHFLFFWSFELLLSPSELRPMRDFNKLIETIIFLTTCIYKVVFWPSTPLSTPLPPSTTGKRHQKVLIVTTRIKITVRAIKGRLGQTKPRHCLTTFHHWLLLLTLKTMARYDHNIHNRGERWQIRSK